jgi:hypothetical protein
VAIRDGVRWWYGAVPNQPENALTDDRHAANELAECANCGKSEWIRRLLLTSAGVRNATFRDALLDMLGHPIEDCTALCIPTAMHGHPHTGPGTNVWEFVAGRSEQPMVELGWKSVGLIELTALPSIDTERWVPLVRNADVLLVWGGDAL